MSKPIVFLSHSSADKAPLAKLKEVLEKRSAGSVDFFLSSDGQSIRLGTNWVVKISDALAQANLMFVFLSPESVGSKWVHFEAGWANARNIKVVPICLPGMDLKLVTPPLGHLQGFNLHGYETLANIARICNEELDRELSEDFTHEEFLSIFENSRGLSEGFFGNVGWAIEEVSFTMERAVEVNEPIPCFQDLAALCKEEGVTFLNEPAKGLPNFESFEMPGAYITSHLTHKNFHLSGTLTPQLYALNGKVLDKWCERPPFKKHWSISVRLTRDLVVDLTRHRLTGKLYNSNITWVNSEEFDFEGLPFALTSTGSSNLRCVGKLIDPRIPRLLARLLELQIISEAPPSVNFFE